jgi:pimeloyl-ACP methyl ester carboxylesterase
MRRVFAGLAIAAALFAMVTAPAAAASGTAPVAHVHRVRVGGDTVTLDCTGAGSPTVILFAGFNGALTTWAHVQRRLSQRTRVCSYDRLGEGSSSAPRHTMTLASNTRLLHRVLAKARVRGPLVLVGHSAGGDVAVKYARTYRRATVGVVLFDATPPGFLRYVLRVIPVSAHGLAGALRTLSAGIITGDNRERLKVAGTRWAPAGSLGRTPLAVVEHGKDIYAPVGRFARRLQGGWARGQRRLARLSRRSQLIIATNSGHNIYLDQPQLALDVINAVIGETRSG